MAMSFFGKKLHRVKDAKVISDPSPSDVIIPVMGPTGVGKSTFINIAARAYMTEVNHGLRSCTKEIVAVAVSYPRDNNCRVVFIDTPGFDDTFEADIEILKRVADWMERSYRGKNKIAGIIYLYDITNARMLGTSRKNFTMFNKLCGKDAAGHVILATTKWGDERKEIGQLREKELSEVYWKQMLRRGSQQARFEHSYESAWNIITPLVEKDALDYIQIQREIVDIQKRIPETDAGKALREDLKEILEEQKALARALKDSQEKTSEFEAKHKAAEKRIHVVLTQIQQLKIPFGRRVATFFKFR